MRAPLSHAHASRARAARSSEKQLLADLRGPPRDVEAVRAEERERDPLEAEAEAGAVCDTAVRELDAEDRGEVVAVVVEGRECGWLGSRDLADDLELQRLLALARRQHASAAPEEGVIGKVELRREAQSGEQLRRPLAPAAPPRLDRLRVA